MNVILIYVSVGCFSLNILGCIQDRGGKKKNKANPL